MAFQLSPGVNVSEIDLTTVVPAVATSIGAIAGVFAWGPVNEVVTISDEVRLAEIFGKPNNVNYEYWFTAANFLAYSNNLKVVRVETTGNATATAANFEAKYLGALGNSLRVETVSFDSFSNWTSTIGADTNYDMTKEFTDSPSENELHIVVIDEDGLFTGTANTILEKYAFVSTIESAKTFDGSSNYYRNVLENRSKYISSKTILVANTDKVTVITANTDATSPDGNVFVTFTGGTSTVTANAIVSVNSETNIIKTIQILNGGVYSNVIGLTANIVNSSAVLTLTTANIEVDLVESLSSGADGSVTNADINNGYDMFKNADVVDVSLVMTGPANQTIVTHVIDEIAEYRKDCVVFVSPERADVVDNYSEEVTDILEYRNTLTSSSYAVMDCNWKYQFDKYNDVYRYVPLNGDIAGLCARTDRDRDPWYSPSGLNRGIIKNVVKLAWNPNKTDRDELYVKGINPVVTFAGEGTILYGDKTLLSRPSAFDRINVRRLFIVLEKAIARAARSSLFEFNDQFTRAQFVNLVEPFLRDVQGRRGVTDFRVVCDETNNTGEVIDRNEFIGDIYIKPARSINFIQLNFVAVRTGVSFDEIVGKFG
jgi:phage tail sheath protein FI